MSLSVSTGLLNLTPSSTPIPPSFSISKRHTLNITASSSSISSSTHQDTTNSSPQQLNNNNNPDNNESKTVTAVKFTYSRASPSIRWPNSKLTDMYPSTETHLPQNDVFVKKTPTLETPDETHKGEEEEEEEKETGEKFMGNRISKMKVKRMNNLALKKEMNWRERVKFLTDRILGLKSDEFVGDLLEQHRVVMTPSDFCFVVKSVGQIRWQRALELYECLNMQQWYAPNARMVATILGVLGKANQEAIAVEIFAKAESIIDDTVQVYNAMMGVYARNGNFDKVNEMFDLMRERGCEPDIVSFNTLINAKVKSCAMVSGLAMQLLDEVGKFGLRPDIITYNTLISACSRESNLKEAVGVYSDMERNRCQPDLWTYNAMISVYGRCGFALNAERLFEELKSKGFSPDAVTYNSLLYAFSKEGNTEKVRDICNEMVKMGFGKDEMTYNTIIDMYGKRGQLDEALQLYRDMKSSKRTPDAVTYTVLIDLLGKASKIEEAAIVMCEMLNAGVKPTLHTYSALICAYAKVGRRVEAEETFNRMRQSGVKADNLAYSVMLDFFLRFNETKKAMVLYQEMVQEGFTPDNGVYEVMLRALVRENMGDAVERIVQDMEKLSGMNPHDISSVLVKGGCYDHGAKMLKVAIGNGYELDREIVLSITSSYSSSGRYSEAHELLEFFREHTPDGIQMITEALIIILCKAGKFDAALEEYRSRGGLGTFRSCTMYESLIQECMQSEQFDIACQLFSDMRFNGVEPSECLYQSMVSVYCKIGFPETAHHLLFHAEKNDIILDNVTFHITDIIETYGKLKMWPNAESIVENLRQKYSKVDRMVWNALIHAYAISGCYERARAIFNTMMRDGPSPNVESVNGLLQALIVDGRLNELYVVIQELQDMDIKISKSSILLMLEAFAQAGNLFEVQKVYNGMKAAGYFPTMHLYRIMIGLLCRFKRVRDVRVMLSEMQEAGLKPDLQIFNSVLKLYSNIEEFQNMGVIYQMIQDAGLTPDEETYNTLITMYCRDHRPEEGLSLMHKMRSLGLDPKRDSYRSLIASFSKQQLYDQAEKLFEELRSNGYNLDRSFFHLMMKMYRTSGDHQKAENLVAMMREAGIEPNTATMHLLMVSYGTSGQPEEADKVLQNLRTMGAVLDTLPYSSVIDAYLKKGDAKAGIEKLTEMKEAAIEPDHRIWTCFIRAASLSEGANDAINLLNALQGVGFDLPIRY
jgi:leucine-rich PPR motif-containing protein